MGPDLAAPLADQGQALARVDLATSCLVAHPNHPVARLGNSVVLFLALKILEQLELLVVPAEDQHTLGRSVGYPVAGSPAVCPAAHHGELASDLLVALCLNGGPDNHQW